MTVRVIQGHVLSVLASLPAKSVHTVCTSPPYWNLRAYQTEPQVWANPDGTPPCEGEHEWGDPITDKKRGQAAGATAQAGNTQKRVCPPETQQGAFCTRCGSWRGELGSEPTLDLFVAHLVDVMAAVGRVLRDDGTLWVNLGDSYNSGSQLNGHGGMRDADRYGEADAKQWGGHRAPDSSLKAGDLCMAPARFALAMQAAGWRLRSEITLCKVAPMPESVQGARWERCRVKTARQEPRARDVGAVNGHQAGQLTGLPSKPISAPAGAEWADCPGCPKCASNQGLVQRWGSGRPTSAKESLFIFAKGAGAYYYDLDAVRVANSAGAVERFGRDARISVDGRKCEGMDGESLADAASRMPEWRGNGRNLWNYVMWSPEPLAAAHYAAFPRFIPRLAIQAGTSEAGVCPTPVKKLRLRADLTDAERELVYSRLGGRADA